MEPAILIVDDTPGNLLALDAALEPLGIETVRAGSGEEAVRLTAGREFAAVLMDVRMPGMDGLEAAAVIRRRPHGREVPIVLMSAVDRDLVHIERGYRAGAIDYLVKPLDDRTLRAKVSVLVELWQARQVDREENERHMRQLQEASGRAGVLLAGVDDLDTLLWTTDVDGRAVHGNRLFLQLGGELGQLGLACLGLLHPDERVPARQYWQQALLAGKTATTAHITWRVRLRDGAYVPYRFRLQRVLREDGTALGWACVGQEERPPAGTMARYGRLLSWLGHELRNPLSALVSVMDLRRRRSTMLAEWEETIVRQLARLKSLALELSRLESEGDDPPTPIHGCPPAVVPPVGRPRVLLVDDNEDGLRALAELLRDAGADVATACTAVEALRVVVDFAPGAAILDIGLPEMDGHELGRQLRAAVGTRQLRLFALSGFGARDDLERSRGAGFDDHFVKPPDLSKLLRVLGLPEHNRPPPS